MTTVNAAMIITTGPMICRRRSSSERSHFGNGAERLNGWIGTGFGTFGRAASVSLRATVLTSKRAELVTFLRATSSYFRPRSLPPRKKFRRELVYHPLPPVRIDPRFSPHATDFLHSPLGTAILRTDNEVYPLHRPESMLHHEPLSSRHCIDHPSRRGKKRPADLNDATLRIVAVVA